jgi:hypothetical protein
MIDLGVRYPRLKLQVPKTSRDAAVPKLGRATGSIEVAANLEERPVTSEAPWTLQHWASSAEHSGLFTLAHSVQQSG